jgi:hypothetical protein
MPRNTHLSAQVIRRNYSVTYLSTMEPHDMRNGSLPLTWDVEQVGTYIYIFTDGAPPLLLLSSVCVHLPADNLSSDLIIMLCQDKQRHVFLVSTR